MFNDILEKIRKPKKNQPPTSEKKLRPVFSFKYLHLHESVRILESLLILKLLIDTTTNFLSNQI